MNHALGCCFIQGGNDFLQLGGASLLVLGFNNSKQVFNPRFYGRFYCPVSLILFFVLSCSLLC